MPQIKFSVWITRSTLPVWDCWSISLHNGYLIISLGLELITNVWILLDISFPTLREVSKTPAPLLTYQQCNILLHCKIGLHCYHCTYSEGKGMRSRSTPLKFRSFNSLLLGIFFKQKNADPPPQKKIIALWLKNKFTPLLPLGKFVFWICPCILMDIQWRDSFTPY